MLQLICKYIVHGNPPVRGAEVLLDRAIIDTASSTGNPMLLSIQATAWSRSRRLRMFQPAEIAGGGCSRDAGNGETQAGPAPNQFADVY